MTSISINSSMRDFDRIEDRLRQHRQVDSRALVIVEGPGDDLVLRQHLPDVAIFSADGKRNVLRAMEAMGSWNIRGVRGVIDADFDEADNDQADDRVIFYEKRDLEGMLISLGVLSSLLEHQGSTVKLTDLGGAKALSEQLVETAMIVARIRAANYRHKWGINFDQVDISSKADRRSLNLDLRRYVSALIQTCAASVSSAEVEAVATAGNLDGRGPRGRDVLALAGLALRHKAGSLPAAATKVELLERQLRSSAAFALDRSEWMAALRVTISEAAAEV